MMRTVKRDYRVRELNKTKGFNAHQVSAFMESVARNESVVVASWEFVCKGSGGQPCRVEVSASYSDGKLTVDTSINTGEAYVPDSETRPSFCVCAKDLLEWVNHALTTTLDAL
jgi:hypothetical protein